MASCISTILRMRPILVILWIGTLLQLLPLLVVNLTIAVARHNWTLLTKALEFVGGMDLAGNSAGDAVSDLVGVA